MSYVRWSSQVRDNCEKCGGSGYVPMKKDDPIDELELGSFFRRVMRNRRLCSGCTSCWYIYAHVGGYISLNHACEGSEEVRLSYEDAPAWRPPPECPMGDVALECVQAAVADYERECG